MKRIIGIIFVLVLMFSVTGFAGDKDTTNKEVKTDKKTAQTVASVAAPMSQQKLNCKKAMKCKKDGKKACCAKKGAMAKDCPKAMANRKACCKKMTDMKKDCPRAMADKKACCKKMADMKKDCPKSMKCKKDVKKPCCSKKLPAKPDAAAPATKN